MPGIETTGGSSLRGPSSFAIIGLHGRMLDRGQGFMAAQNQITGRFMRGLAVGQ